MTPLEMVNEGRLRMFRRWLIQFAVLFSVLILTASGAAWFFIGGA